jgi:NAD(P)H dehydrogenase (quinone)
VVTVAIVVHSEYGHTWRQAQAVCDGVRAAGADVQVVRIDEAGIVEEAGWDVLTNADGVLFGCPTHMGGPSWQFKRFADASGSRPDRSASSSGAIEAIWSDSSALPTPTP